MHYSIAEGIDIQCFTEINQNMINHLHRKKYQDTVRHIDRRAKHVWVNTNIPMESEYKAGGASIISFNSVSGRIKECGRDRKGR